MKIGIIGAGMIGATTARLFVNVGHDVAVSNSRGPESLRALVSELGPRARAMTVDDAASFGDIVLLAVPWRRGFAVLQAAANGVLTGGRPDSGRVAGALTVASQNLRNQTLILHVEGAQLRGAKPGPLVLLRGDMDALPIDEQTGLDFSSRVGGAMHAFMNEGANMPEGKRSITLRVEYRADERTLRDEEVDAMHARVVAALEEAFGAQLRG